MDCVCSDELCHCKAFQLVHSLQGNNTVGNASPARNGTVAEFSITGMTCAMCSQAIERAVRTVRGVESVQVSLVTDTATVQWQDVNDTGGSTGRGRTRDSIVQSIEDIGYQVTSVVVLSRSSSANNTGSNGHGDSNQNPSSSVAERWQLYRRNQYNKVRERRAAALWAMVATLPIVVWTMILPHVLPHVTDNWRVRLPQWLPVSSHSLHVDTLAVWILATLVQFICGWDFYKSAWYGFRNQTAGMDLLIVLGTTASYGYATSGVIWNSTAEDAHAMHFFETSTVLIVLVLVGKWMQAAAIRQTSDALTQLMELQSTTAVRITPQEVPNNQGSPRSASGRGNVPQREQRPSFNPLIDPYVEEVVSIEHVSVGDVVKVLRGASVPADGIVLFGEMAVDESMMTGESFPVLKTRGSVVLGGTICVDSGENGGEESDEQPPSVGAAFVQITGVGSSTALAQMVQLVQQAQTRAVPIQAFADRVSAVFVPAVCLISLVTYLVW
jgi:P-type Cu+ transporter